MPRSSRWGSGAREHLGFGPAEVERPVALQDVRLAPARLDPPAALASICRSDPYERALALLRSGLPGRGARLSRPLRPSTRRRGASARRARARAGTRMVRRRRRGGDPLRRGHERGRGGRAASPPGRRREHRSQGDGSRARGRSGIASRAHPGRRHRSAARGAAQATGAHAAPLPAVVRVLDPRRVDRHARGRALRHASHTHRRLRGVGSGDHPAWRVGEQEAARLGRGAEPRPHADRLGGHPGSHHRGVGARAGGPTLQGVRGRPVRLIRGRRAEPCGRWHRRGCSRRTAACSTRTRRRSPAPLPRAGRCSCWVSRATALSRRPWRRRSSSAARPAASRASNAASRRAPGATPSCVRPTCATR